MPNRSIEKVSKRKEPLVVLTLRVSSTVKDEIEEIARKEGSTPSLLGHLFLTTGLNAHKTLQAKRAS
jgi:hypothetical protein